MSCCLPFLRTELIAAILGLAVLGTTPAGAQPLEAQETSVKERIDSFVSYLKSETNEALWKTNTPRN